MGNAINGFRRDRADGFGFELPAVLLVVEPGPLGLHDLARNHIGKLSDHGDQTAMSFGFHLQDRETGFLAVEGYPFNGSLKMFGRLPGSNGSRLKHGAGQGFSVLSPVASGSPKDAASVLLRRLPFVKA